MGRVAHKSWEGESIFLSVGTKYLSKLIGIHCSLSLCRQTHSAFQHSPQTALRVSLVGQDG